MRSGPRAREGARARAGGRLHRRARHVRRMRARRSAARRRGVELMKALSLRQPWAWAVVHGGKRVENRGWTTDYRGPLLIHASTGMTRGEYEDAVAFMLGRKLV